VSYVESHLQADEKVLDRTSLHWIVNLPGLLLLLLAPCVFVYFNRPPSENWHYLVAAPLLTAIVGVVVLLNTAIARLTTEIAITNRRIIYKTGLLSRRTVEMNVDKVESVDVNQSILGRLLDFGTIVVRGVGTGIEPLEQIAAPLEFRDAVLLLTASQAVSPTVSASGSAGRNPAIQDRRAFGHRPMTE
jgi:uncharacterized membrane protein YdbT with pleckstrin-like domain